MITKTGTYMEKCAWIPAPLAGGIIDALRADNLSDEESAKIKNKMTYQIIYHCQFIMPYTVLLAALLALPQENFWK